MIRLEPSEAKKLSSWLNWGREDKGIYILSESKQLKENKINIDTFKTDIKKYKN